MGTQIAAPLGVEARPEPRGLRTGTALGVAEELAKAPHEPFLPVENRLVAWSLILGLVLLGGLVWVGSTFFPG
jgi:hypothetical protein